MNIISVLFLHALCNINSINNSNKKSTLYNINGQICNTLMVNNIIWTALLKLLGKTDNFTISDIINKFNEIDNKALLKVITLIKNNNSDNDIITFNEFNQFLLKLKESDYVLLINTIENDGLNTPSDWSAISSEDDSINSIIELDLNDKINFIENPLIPNSRVKNYTIESDSIVLSPLHDNDTSSNETSDNETSDNEASDNEASDNKTSDSEAINRDKNAINSPNNTVEDVIITESPSPVNNSSNIKFYNPNNIVFDNTSKSCYRTYCKDNCYYNTNNDANNYANNDANNYANNDANNYANNNEDNSKKYAWYIQYLLKFHGWVKSLQLFQVPNWVKKYF